MDETLQSANKSRVLPKFDQSKLVRLVAGLLPGSFADTSAEKATERERMSVGIRTPRFPEGSQRLHMQAP